MILDKILNWLFPKDDEPKTDYDPMLAPTDDIVLRTLAELGQAHAGAIRDRIEDNTGRFLPIGRLFVVLDRLEEDKQFIKSHQEPGGPERGFRHKRVYEFASVELKKLYEKSI